MIGHSSPISGIAACSRFVATAGYDNQVILWEARSKTAVARGYHDHLANQCVFSPNGRYLATASSDHTARLWSAATMKLAAVFDDHDDDVEMIAFNPVHALVATASRDHKVRIFRLNGTLLKTMVGHRADVISVTWSADGSELISSSDDGTVRVWNLVSGRLIQTIDMEGVETDTLVIDPAGTIYAGTDTGEISVMTRNARKTTVAAHKAGIKRLVVNGERLVSLSYDRTFKVWDIDQLQGLKTIFTADMPPIVWPRSCAFLGDDKLVFGTFGSSYATFDMHHQDWDLSVIGLTRGINAVASFDKALLTVGDDGIVRRDGRVLRSLDSLCNFLTPFDNVVLTGGQMGCVFDALTGELLYQHTSPLNCGATFVSGGQKKAIIGAYTGEGLVLVKDSNGKLALDRVVKLHTNAVKGLASNNDVIYSVCATGAAAWHDGRNFAMLASVERAHDKIANGCTSLAGNSFASVSRDLKLRVWSNGGELIEVIDTPHTHSIKCVAATCDGRYVATAAYNGRAAVFDRLKCSWILDRRLTASGISSLAAVADGFVAGSYDGQTYTIDCQ